MNSFTRLAGYAMILVLVFLAATLAARAWLQHQTVQWRAEAVTAKRQQLAAAVAASHRPGQDWNGAYLHELGEIIGATVTLRESGPIGTESDPVPFYFEAKVDEVAGAPVVARVTFLPSPMLRLVALHQRVVLGLGLLGVALLCILFALILVPSRPAVEGAPPAPWASARTEMSGLTQLAKTSAAQSAELHRERDVRQRAEEEVQFKQRLLAQSLEEKIRLGHDLHDGIIQSLYAVGLTLESVRTLASTNPVEADARLEKCRQSLNDTIRSVRAYITGLAPEALRRVGFSRALEALIDDLHADQAVKFNVRVDEDAAVLLSAEQGSDALQIASEAISNSLRHGHATNVTVRLHQTDGEICLLIQDNGAGFNISGPTDGHGHGLRNMQARAERLGGVARIESQRSAGTRVIITLPVRLPA